MWLIPLLYNIVLKFDTDGGPYTADELSLVADVTPSQMKHEQTIFLNANLHDIMQSPV